MREKLQNFHFHGKIIHVRASEGGSWELYDYETIFDVARRAAKYLAQLHCLNGNRLMLCWSCCGLHVAVKLKLLTFSRENSLSFSTSSTSRLMMKNSFSSCSAFSCFDQSEKLSLLLWKLWNFTRRLVIIFPTSNVVCMLIESQNCLKYHCHNHHHIWKWIFNSNISLSRACFRALFLFI